MVFSQILSHMPLLSDQWLPRYKNYHPLYASSVTITFCGVAGWKMVATRKKQILNEFYTICQDLKTTLFSFSKKKFFSLHPTGQWSLVS